MSEPAGDLAWARHRVRASAADHHARVPRSVERREVWVCDVDAPALVLGSHQPDDVVDRDAARRAQVAVVRRRTGGGAVLLEPGAALWIDVVVPRRDPLWTDDVRRSFGWVGEWWRRSLEHLGVHGTAVDGFEPGTWGELVCFAGRGPGEVVDRHGAKLVGLAQRRTASAAHIQALALGRWAPSELLGLLALPPAQRRRAEDAVAAAAAPLPVSLDALTAVLLDALP